MSVDYRSVVIAWVISMMAPLAAANPTLDLSEKAALQAAMRGHIERNLVDGAYLALDARSGGVERLRPNASHPMIMKMGEFYVLCADFRGANGRKVNIDFYLARAGKRYVVFDRAIDNRALLQRLSKTGKLERVK